MRSGSSLDSYTEQIQAVRVYEHPKYANRLVLVDTPGFDDTNKSDKEILQMIGDWLKKTYFSLLLPRFFSSREGCILFTRYENSIKLAGIVYLHRITDNRMAGTPHRNLRMFAELCGNQGLKKVILATTMWDQVTVTTGAQREHDLRVNYWKVMMDKGASIARFQNTHETAWEIIDKIVQKTSTDALLIQKELVDRKLRLNETKAGKALRSNLEESLLEQQRKIRFIAQKMREESDPLDLAELGAEYILNEAKYQRTLRDMKDLHIPLSRKIRLFFSRNSY